MFLRELGEPVSRIRGAGSATVKALAKAGINTLADLLCHYPRDYEDRSRLVPLAQFARYPQVCTTVTVLSHEWIGFGRMRTLKVRVADESARAVLICWNRNFLEKQLTVGGRYLLWGRFHYKYGEIQSSAFEVSPLGNDMENGAGGGTEAGGPGMGGILPVYPLSAGLNQGMFRRLVKRALDSYAPSIDEELPAALIEKEGLLPKARAIRNIHFPAAMAELDRARKTLIWGELFYLELIVGRRALERKGALGGEGSKKERAKGEPLSSPGPVEDTSARPSPVEPCRLSALQRRLLERLPFELTPGQKKAAEDINRDIDGPWPMVRLLQGDVGSGKTLVSFLAALGAADSGGQAAIMAPTELLARQHAENAARLLEPLGLRLSFLTGNIKAAGRRELLKNLAAGEIDLVLGTHALFSDDVVYRNLRLVVVDEQHRFGVTQRGLIMAKGNTPDLLMMSATPIPRSLALTIFGDLDISTIRDLPPGRKPVKTHLARESNEGKVYDFVRKELAAGRQAYFVYPLVEAAEPGTGQQGSLWADLKDAESMANRLAREVFPEFPTALVHSRIEEEEKRRIMDSFRRGDIRILTATSVVEVGVDVPNASCMVIEHAERFGLSALHQLRGRVGRGKDQSYCFLVYSDKLTEDGKKRLMVMLENQDGFVIAEEDLKLRGPGQIAGLEQSGYLSLGLADPVRDVEILARARAEAFAILETDPGLLLPEHRPLAEVLERAPPFGNVVM